MANSKLQNELRRRTAQLGLSARALSMKAGLNDTAVKMILNGKSANPRHDTVQKLARVLGCTPNDLLGETSAPKQQHALADEGTPVAELDVYASAGGGAHIEDEKSIAEWRFPSDWLRTEIRGSLASLKIITIEGDSMAGTLDPGDKVIVDLARTTPSPPGIFAVHDGLALVAKRLEYIEGSEPPTVRIISDNERYKPYERTADEVKVVGRIMGRWQRL